MISSKTPRVHAANRGENTTIVLLKLVLNRLLPYVRVVATVLKVFFKRSAVKDAKQEIADRDQ